MARTKGRRSCWTAADVRGPLLTSEEAAVTAAADSRRASAPTARGALPPVHAGPGPTPCRRLYRLPRYAGRPNRRHYIRQGRNRDIRRRLTRPPLGSLLTAARRSPARPVRRLQRRRYTRDDHQKTPWLVGEPTRRSDPSVAARRRTSAVTFVRTDTDGFTCDFK